MGLSRSVGALGLAVIALAMLAAPIIAPNAPFRQFKDRAYAPPMRVHVGADGASLAPFVYGYVLEDRPLHQYRVDPNVRVPLWGGTRGASEQPALLLGGDALGRDLFSRLLFGARLSLGVTLAGAAGAILIGAVLGGLAGASGGRLEAAVMLLADYLLVLPGLHLVLVLRAALPQVLDVAAVFWLMAGLFALAGWPHVARGVRAIVSAERGRDYAEAARAAGAGRLRLLGHLLPAARSFLAVELVLLIPAMLVAEATISFIGLGFAEPVASWGTMLQEASNITNMTHAPWMLAPAGALFLVVLCVQLVAGGRAATFATLATVRRSSPLPATRPVASTMIDGL